MELKPGYKQTEVGVIPEDWEAKSVHEFATVKTGPFGTLLKAAEYSAGNGVPLISVGEIREGFLEITDNTPRVPYAVLRRLPQYVLKEDDIVFGRKGGVERSALVRKHHDGWFLGSDGISIRPSKQCHAEYLAFQFQNDRVQGWLLRNAIGTTMPSLNQEILRRVAVPLPPTKAEQKAIAEALSDADALIESLEQLIAKKRHLKQGAMQELLRPKAGWVTIPFGSATERIIGGGTPSRAVPGYWSGEIPWMTVKDFAQHNLFGTIEYITKDGLKNSASNLIPKGTVITSTRMALGKAARFQVAVSINQDLKAIFPKKGTDTLFLYYWFQSNERLISELGSGSTVMGLSLAELRQIPLSKPPIEEQTAIANILSDMDAEIAALEAKLAKARQLKRGMMQNLLTGKIRLV